MATECDLTSRCGYDREREREKKNYNNYKCNEKFSNMYA